MTLEHTERTLTTATPAPAITPDLPASTGVESTVRTERTTMTPGRPELGRRITVLIFGLIQLLIGLRIVLLVLDAREGNGLVSAILNLSQLFVAPFEGILRSDAMHAGGSTLDFAAVVAIIGWTVLEFVVIKALAVFRRETV
ncbi:MAG TPA: hypothetical protein VHL56_07785 [Candidatus Limnocylindrales bacterium]|jgi:hypothetical protein|nr:hypothetical protein [Candidatus Limnocylindrales bacterium]